MLDHTPSGNGYWIVHSDGSVWSFGDAQYCGGCNPGAPAQAGKPGIPAGLLAAGELHLVMVAAWPSGHNQQVALRGVNCRWFPLPATTDS